MTYNFSDIKQFKGRLVTEAKGDKPAWIQAEKLDKFVDGPVFLGPGWFVTRGYPGSYLPLELVSDDCCHGRVAICETRVPGLFRRWELLGDPCLEDDRTTLAKALESLLRMARLNGVDMVFSFSNMARWATPELDEVLEGAYTEAFGTYAIDLNQEIDQIKAGMNTGHRRLLRKAEAANVEVRSKVDADAFVALMEKTYQRGGKNQPFDAVYLRRLIDSPQMKILAVSTYLDDELQAALLVPYDRQRGYFLHGASAAKPARGSVQAAHVAVMKELKNLGIPEYDFGGARKETDNKRLAGIFRFKKSFGGEFIDSVRWRMPLTIVGRIELSFKSRS
jgi:Acetyltransferase (GNAT) domain